MALPDESLWRRLSPLLDRALELSDGERSALVADLHAADRELAEALERALAADGRAAAAGLLAAGAVVPRSLAGLELGPYRLVERIGAGGMGTVWRARRVDGRFEGEVALKLLHPSLIEGDSAERFRREGTILSRLTHPGIARLYDAGVSESGQPYLVLELVDGERIDHHADARRLDVDSRLLLFLQVAEAVADAHSNLVVHRDLKPSNILVDRDGRVKLLDFGIATLLDAASGEAERRTQTAARALTPQYAAPEQLEGRPVTTATDVYALGVLLYELLTGEHPSARSDGSPAELVRAITAGEPPRMSGRVRRAATESAELDRFAARATGRERLARALAGDLDTIVAKALRKNPAERYLTVAALADDLSRHLHDQPVRARPDSLFYRLRKLLRRRRLESGAVAVAAVALVVSASIAWRQARASAAERDLALEELQRAEITNDLSGFLLSEANPSGSSISKSELLARAEAMIEGRFADDPAAQAHMLLVLSSRYYEVSDYPRWKQVLARAYELAIRSDDTRLRAVASCEFALAVAELDRARAESLIASADVVLGSRSVAPSAIAERARCRLNEAIIANWAGEFTRAITAAEASLAFEAARPGPSGRGADALNTLGLAQGQLGRFADANDSFERLFALLASERRMSTRSEVVYRHNWTLALLHAGQMRRALAESERVAAVARHLGGEVLSPYMLSTLASLRSYAGRHEEAIEVAERSMTLSLGARGSQMPFWTFCIGARVYAEAGRPDRAATLIEELERHFAAIPSAPAWLRGMLDVYRAAVAIESGDADTALRDARRAVETLEAEKRPTRDLLQPLLLAARAENDRRDFAAASRTAERALAMARAGLGGFAHSRELGLAELELARAATGAGNRAGARAGVERAVEHLRASMGDDAPETRRARALSESVAAGS